MPLLMLDLDNTLVDRDGAFREAATVFLAEHAPPAGDLTWLMTFDASGYTPRHDVAEAMAGRYGAVLPERAVQAFLDRGAADRVVLPDATRAVLGKAVDDGWMCAIVTNGRVVQQETKIRSTGLDRAVHGWVISEAVGHKKPAPEIFHAAAAATGTSLPGAWMIGDSPQAAIPAVRRASARAASGCRAADRVGGGKAAYRPTHTTEDAASAINYGISIPK
jgi:putative hydrolase of the HAD superfamily